MKLLLVLLVSGLLFSHLQAQTPSGDSGSFSKGGSTTITPPSDPATEDQIREYLSLTRVEKYAHELMDQQIHTMQLTAAAYIPASFFEDFRTEFRKVDVGAAYVTVYQKYLSKSEMQTVIDFYRSPGGKKLLDAQPLAITDAQAILRETGQKIGEKIGEKYANQIAEGKKKYESGVNASKPAATK